MWILSGYSRYNSCFVTFRIRPSFLYGGSWLHERYSVHLLHRYGTNEQGLQIDLD